MRGTDSLVLLSTGAWPLASAALLLEPRSVPVSQVEGTGLLVVDKGKTGSYNRSAF